MTGLVTREELGFQFNGVVRDLSRITSLVVHHTPGRDRTASPVGQWGIVHDFHSGTSGHPSITGGVGYHLGLSVPYDTVLEGRPFNQVGAHAQGFNSQSIGIAILGPGDADIDGAIGMLREVYRELIVPNLNNLQLFGHRDVGNTSCPSEGLWRRIDEIAEEPEKPKKGNRMSKKAAKAIEELARSTAVSAQRDLCLQVADIRKHYGHDPDPHSDARWAERIANGRTTLFEAGERLKK